VIKNGLKFEHHFYKAGYNSIIGIDEAGRGPLAGPLCVAGVMFKANQVIPEGINDSKKISAKKRQELYNQIIKSAEKYKVVLITPKRIDEINILNAVKEGMRKVAKSLEPDFVLTDAVNINYPNVPQLALIKGDSQSISIAAASILAKVTRDNEMMKYAKKYPKYGFEKHMGYGTKIHIEAIKTHGYLNIHRKSFQIKQ